MMNRYLKNRRAILTAALLAAIAGCVMVEDLAIYRTRPIRFSHVTHVEKEGWKCEACHREALTEDLAGMPPPRLCRKCHQTNEEIQTYLNPFAPDNKLMWTDVTGLSEDAIFSHKLHYDERIECDDCHPGIRKSQAVSEELRVEKADCVDCHARERVSGDCNVCHREINKDWKPANHEQSWNKFHGPTTRIPREDREDLKCSLCHPDSECSACHQDRPPSDHDQYWRRKAHGMAAGMDRERCAACHQSYTCDACHKETTPQSHGGSWGQTRNRHCLACHFPLQRQQCNVCHKTASGHNNASSLPDNITHQAAGAYECRTCHVRLGTLRHYDNGDNCRYCHY